MEYKQPMLPFEPRPKRNSDCGCDGDNAKIVIEIDAEKVAEMIVPMLPKVLRRYGLHD